MAEHTVTLDTRNGLPSLIGDLASILGEPSTIGEVQQLSRIIEAAEQELGLKVRDAVRMGHTWQQIGDALGVSRQAAHKRFGLGTIDRIAADGKYVDARTS